MPASLQVAGNMGDVLEAVNPSIKSTLVKCMRQPATTLSVQLAAIQAFRRMSVTDEVNHNPYQSTGGVKNCCNPLLWFFMGRLATTSRGSASTPKVLSRSAWPPT